MPAGTVIAVGSPAGGPAVARLVEAATDTTLLTVSPYESGFTGGVRAAAFDLTGDGVADLVTAPGQGGGPRVRAFDGTTGTPLLDLFAFDPSFAGGLFVAAGRLPGGGAGIGVGAGPGGGPRVRVLTAAGATVSDTYVGDPAARDGVPEPAVAGLWGGDGGWFGPAEGGGGQMSLMSGSSSGMLPSPARPEGAGDAYAVVHDRALSVSAAEGVLANDPSYAYMDPAAPVAKLESGVTSGQFALAEDGGFEYAPDPLFVGEDGFTYRVWVGEAKSDPIPVRISVTNYNLAVYGGGTYFFDGYTKTWSVPLSDGDGDAVTAVRVAGPNHGDIVWRADGSYDYTPHTPPAPYDGIRYFAADPIEESTSHGLHLLGLWDAVPLYKPVAYGQSGWTVHDRPLSATLSGSAPLDENGGPNQITFDIPSKTTAGGTLAAGPNPGDFVYTPPAGYTGPDGFYYTVSAGGQTSDPAPIALTVTNVKPVTRADAFQVQQGDTITRSAYDGALANDTDLDDDVMVASLVSGPAVGDLAFGQDGSFEYTPPDDFYGHVQFTYKVSDGAADSRASTVTISVTPTRVGDRVWLDADGDGLQTPGEPGIAGAAVELLDASDGVLVSTVTDADGCYGFRGLEPDATYKLHFSKPIGSDLVYTKYNVDDDATDTLDNDANWLGYTESFELSGDDSQQPDQQDAGMTDPKVEIKNISNQSIDKIKVSKWLHAFQISSGKPKVIDGFAATDTDGFYFEVFDPSKNKNRNIKDSFLLDIRVATPIPGSTEVTENSVEQLVQESGINTGVFVSPITIATSNEIDTDKVKADPVHESYPLQVKLKDKVVAHYNNKTYQLASVPQQKTVNVQVIVLRATTGGQPVVSEQAVVTDVYRQANRSFAQAALGINITTETRIIDPPDGVDLTDGLSIYTGDGTSPLQLTNEVKALINSTNLNQHDSTTIQVYYVNEIRAPLSIPGFTLFPAMLTQVDATAYGRSVFVSSTKRRIFTAAHEIGHALTLEHPQGIGILEEVKLMYSPTSQDDVASAISTKRLRSDEVDQIYTDPQGLLQ